MAAPGTEGGVVSGTEADTSSKARSNFRFLLVSPIWIAAALAGTRFCVTESAAIRTPSSQTSCCPTGPIATRSCNRCHVPVETFVALLRVPPVAPLCVLSRLAFVTDTVISGADEVRAATRFASEPSETILNQVSTVISLVGVASVRWAKAGAPVLVTRAPYVPP